MERESSVCRVAETESQNCSRVTDGVSIVEEGSTKLCEYGCGCSCDCLRSPQNTSTAKTQKLVLIDNTAKDRFANQEENSSVIKSPSEVKTVTAEGAVNIKKEGDDAEAEKNGDPFGVGSSRAQDGSVETTYLDDNHERNRKIANKRPTKAQIAAMDALASFGGSDLGSITFKRRDLRDELKMEAEQFTSQSSIPEETTKRPPTRLQAAKQETDAIFKHIPLGEGVRRKVPSSFKRKRARDEEEGCEMKRVSKVNKAKIEALETFGGASLASLSKKPKTYKSEIPNLNQQPDPPQHHKCRLTRVERARLESLHSFGGCGLEGVLTEAKKRVARTLEVKCKESERGHDTNKNKEDIGSDKENAINQVI